MPNLNSLRRLEVAFFGRFVSRFYGRHYWLLFQKLACKLAEVTSKAHLKPSAYLWLLAAENLTVVEGRLIYQVISFTQWIRQAKASFPWRSACCCWAAENFLCGFDFHYKYLHSGHTRPPDLNKRSCFISLFSAQVKNSIKLFKIFRTPSTCVSKH